MKSTFKIIGLTFITFLAISCGSAGKKSWPDKGDDPRTQFEYKLEEMALLEDEGIVTSGVPEAKEIDDSSQFDLTPKGVVGPSDKGQFFSAQIFASKSSSEAKEYKESIESLFEDEVRVDYQAPYYKVCVGKVQGFDESQELLKRVSAIGFSKAWLVKLRK